MSNKDNEKLQIHVKARKVGNSMTMTLPEQHVNRLNIEEGDQMTIQAEKGEHGKYASIWNQTKQGEDQ